VSTGQSTGESTGESTGVGDDTTSACFVLNAEILDDGEAITSITIQLPGPIAAASLTAGTFSVHATGTSPIPVAVDEEVYREYDLDREVVAARLDADGTIVLDLSYGVDELGCGSLAFVGHKGWTRLNMVYTITQNAPLTGLDGEPITIERFEQGRVVSPEVDAFSYHESPDGVKYRLFTPPSGAGPRPLVVWLHGGGEGAILSDGYYDNETQLRATRGALSFTTPQAQQIFGGAYVFAPQCTANWLDDGPLFASQVHDLIKDLVGRLPIDSRRIYLTGGSSGGYQTLEMISRYPDLFAAAVPCSGLVAANPRYRGPGEAPRLISDDALAQIATPTWLIVSADDETVDPQANSVRAHQLIPGSRISVYDDVTWQDFLYPGHWSWVYLAHNDPAIEGTHVWQWMAAQRR
jgi:predicted peptidase